MRVALLSAEYPPLPGGVGDYTEQLGQALVAQGQHVVVFTIYDFGFTIYDLGASDRNPQIVHRTSSWGWGVWRDVLAALSATQPDILHIQYQTGAYAMHPAINFLPWRLARLRSRPRVAVTAHDLLPPYLFPNAGPLRGWVTRRLLADADAVVVTNQADYQEVGRWGLGDGKLAPALIPIGSNIAVAPPPGYDRAAWRAQLGAGPGDTLLAYFGLISRTKGLDTLLTALAGLPKRTRLLVIGGGASAPEDRAFAEAIVRQIDALGLGARVTITGHCPAPEVSAHLLAADIAALPFADGASFRRGSLLAALAHGLPTVTTAPVEPRTENQEPDMSPSVLDSWFSVLGLVHGKQVLLVPPGDPAALAGAIRELASSPERRAQLGASGRALAAEFGWERIAERHGALYRRMIATAGATAAPD